MTTDTERPLTASGQGPEAGRALQTQAEAKREQQKALVAAHDTAGDHLIVKGGATSDDKMLERVEAIIRLPATFQYAIPIKGVKNLDGSWNNDMAKVGITADGYDYLNRVIGCSFFFPPVVYDENGNERPNPIHRPDYVYMRVIGVWRNPIGQLVSAPEDVEVDFKLLYQNKRANAKSAAPAMGEEGPLWDEAGNMILKLTPEDELKAYRELTQNRSFGPRYAITVARVRILKMATGLRSLPSSQVVDGYPVKVVGFRDMMTPDKRFEQAGGDLASMYGRPVDIKPLTGEEEEMAGLRSDLDAEETAEREMVAEATANQQEPETPAPGNVASAAAPVAPTSGEPTTAWDPEDIKAFTEDPNGPANV